jgi:hypothetical protein
MQDRTVVAEIKALEDRRYDAMLGNDLATLDRLLSEQLVYTHSNGQRDTKNAYLKRVESGHFKSQYRDPKKKSACSGTWCGIAPHKF